MAVGDNHMGKRVSTMVLVVTDERISIYANVHLCARALEIGARTFGSVKFILDNNLDRQAAPKRAEDGLAIQHRNILGSQ
jgi:hypothetical protein